jgi:RNA polymerase sigma factor for flagellar operon FliA
MPDRPGESLLLSELPTIDRIVAFIRVRHHLSASDADEFAAHVRLKLVEDEYAVLRKFEGRSSLRTYLTVVIQRLFLDYRTSAWGKWRPSAEARRLGELAIQAERLVTRDGYSLDEAYEVLTTNHGVGINRGELEQLVEKLPCRVRRSFEGEESLQNVVAPDLSPDAALEEQGRAVAAARVSQALSRTLATLDVRDRLILTMRFEDGRTVAEIARVLHVDQKALYRRCDRLLLDLRAALEREGVNADEVLDILGTGRGRPRAEGEGRTRRERPSMTVGAKE